MMLQPFHRSSLTDPFESFAQVLVSSAKKPRKSLNGDPDWHMMEAPAILGDSIGAQLSGLSDLQGEPLTAMSVAMNAGFCTYITEYEQGGGGWSLACKKAGVTSSITNDIAWTYRCKSHTAFGCPAQIKIIYKPTTDSLTVLHAKGWEHKHDGTLNITRGLPPPVKVIVDTTVDLNPTLKFQSLWNLLVEQHKVDPSLKTSVQHYFYKHARARNAEHCVSLGVSSYGAVEAWVVKNRLIDLLVKHEPTATQSYLDVAGVIGSFVRLEEQRCAVMISTPKLLLDAAALGTLGFSKGQLHLDHTFKLLHEQIPFFVTSVPDIGQHVHMVMLGPTTHMDAEMTALQARLQDEQQLGRPLREACLHAPGQHGCRAPHEHIGLGARIRRHDQEAGYVLQSPRPELVGFQHLHGLRVLLLDPDQDHAVPP